MKRVICVWFPEWPIQRWCVAQRAPEKQPIVLFHESLRGGLQVTHCSRRAVGIVPGMPLAEARALVREGRFEQHDPAADDAALRNLAIRCQQFSPIVGLGEEGSLLMDVTGCSHLFGGEAAMVRQVARFLSRLRLTARVGMADTIGAAWAVCRYGRAGVVVSGERAAALDGLPVAALRLAESIVVTLNELDVRTIGQLRSLPRGSLAVRFGASVANRLDQAFGERAELIVPVKTTEPARAACVFDEPVTDRRLLELSLYQLIEQLADTLSGRQVGVQRLDCRLDNLSFTVGTTHPTNSVAHLWELVRLHLEGMSLPREVNRVGICAVMTGGGMEQQAQLIRDERVDPRELQLLLDRLGSRLGEESLLCVRREPDPLPEFACRYEPVLQGTAPTEPTPAPEGLFRPLRMSPRPVPVEVMSLVPEGPPIRFRWKGEDHAISHPWGPERIASGWWRGEQVHRDYYRVETATGERFWLFRIFPAGAWFLHGVFE